MSRETNENKIERDFDDLIRNIHNLKKTLKCNIDLKKIAKDYNLKIESKIDSYRYFEDLVILIHNKYFLNLFKEKNILCEIIKKGNKSNQKGVELK